jgi:ribose 5-phosphate isomerase B
MDEALSRLGFGADDAGLALKDFLFASLGKLDTGYRQTDFGIYAMEDSIAYPTTGLRVAEAVARHEIERAILVCGTGIGMAISANKVVGVRATVAYDAYSVERSVLSNNCQVLALGSRVVAPPLALTIARQWLALRFDDDSPSAGKVAILDAYETSRDERPIRRRRRHSG